jgi:hypothetical protein
MMPTKADTLLGGIGALMRFGVVGRFSADHFWLVKRRRVAPAFDDVDKDVFSLFSDCES